MIVQAGGAQIQVAVAATLQELTNQKSALQKQIDQKNKEAAEKKAAAEAEKKRQAELASLIKKIDGDINSTESRIGQTEGLIDETGKGIDGLQVEIAQKEQEIGKKKEDLYETAVEYHIALDQGNEVSAILASDRLSQALDQSNSFGSLADKLVLDGEALDKERQDFIAKKAQLVDKQQSLKTQRDQLSAYQQALDAQKNQKSALIDQSKQAQETYLAQAADATKVSQQLKSQFAAVSNEEAAMRRAASQKNVTASRKNATSALGFIWPVDGIITTQFGGSTPFQNYHTGMDIAGPAGDAVVATFSGVITRAEQQYSPANGGTKPCGTTDYGSYGYGNWIEIKHDNGYKTRYAHLMKCNVGVGQRVERGQVIGYRGGAYRMAGAGWSTGAHLHFEVWDSQGPFDPRDVLP